MKKTLLSFILILSLSFINSCSKSEPTNCEFENPTFIGSWKLTKIMKNSIDSTTAYFALNPCEKTETMKLNDDQSLNITNTVSSCPNIVGYWQISTLNKTTNYIRLADNNSSQEYQVTSFSCSNFTILRDSFSFTYTKQ